MFGVLVVRGVRGGGVRRRLLSELGIRVRIKFRLSPEVAVVHQERIVV